MILERIFVIMICGMTYYQILWYFILYSFGGWIIEVIFHAVTLGKVINRGFLNGPLCPVYGFGMLSVLAAVNTVEGYGLLALKSGSTDKLGTLLLFIGGMVLATLVELIAGWLLDVAFHTRWWDYSDKPFNFHGYICLEFSIIWGLGITMIVRILQPMVEASGNGFRRILPEKYGWYVLLVIYMLIAADMIITIMTVIGLNKKLKQIDEVREKMRLMSNTMSEVIGTGTIKTSQAVEMGQVQAALAKAELRDAAYETGKQFRRETAAVKRNAAAAAEGGKAAISGYKNALNDQFSRSQEAAEVRLAELESQLAALRKSLTSRSPVSARRLIEAFPQMRSHEHNETLERLREFFKQK